MNDVQNDDAANAAAILVRKLGEFMSDAQIRLENNCCRTEIENILFAFFYSPEFSSLFIQASVGDPKKADDQDALLEGLLQSNHLWDGTAGGIFGLNPEDGLLYYNYRLDFPLSKEPLYEDLLIELMPGMVGAVEAARAPYEEQETLQ
jgi:hypothetical protein